MDFSELGALDELQGFVEPGGVLGEIPQELREEIGLDEAPLPVAREQGAYGGRRQHRHPTKVNWKRGRTFTEAWHHGQVSSIRS